jgi:hypothetical protein
MPERLAGTPCRTAHRSGSRALPSLLRVTRSATSEHLLGLLGSSPIPRSLVASRARLHLRPLPSTGVTRFPRYLRASPPPQAAQSDSHESPVDPSAITAGASRVASGPRCLHAVATTPAGPIKPVRSYCSIGIGLPRCLGRSAPAFDFSRPAQRSLALRPACSPSRHATLFTEGFSGFVTSTTASIVTGRNEPAPGRDFHPLWTSAFSRRTEHVVIGGRRVHLEISTVTGQHLQRPVPITST